MSSQPRNSYRSPFLSPLTPSHMQTSGPNHELHSNARPMFLSTAQKGVATDDNQETVDVVWNPIQVQVDLQKACQILTQHHLKCSAKWIAEMAVGLSVSADAPPEEEISSTIPDHFWWSPSATHHPALFQYARTLLDLGDCAMAASVLSVGTPDVAESALTRTMPPPLPNLSAPEVFVRSYALYMAGEKCKEEEMLDMESEGKTHSACRNPYLADLLQDLYPEYEANNLDAFGLYAYGVILSAAIPTAVPIPPSAPSAHHVLIQSILQFPYNWSAWLDLASLIISTQETSTSSAETKPYDIEQDILDQIQPVLADNFMYHLFCAHVHCERQSFQDAMLIYERWMDANMFSSSPYLRSQYSLCCYNLRNYSMAKDLLQELHVTLPYRLDSMDIYSNVLYVLEDTVALSQLAHLAVQVDKYRPETCCIVGNYYSIKKQRAKAIQYFQRALQLDRTFTSAYTLMGHEYVEWKQTANAMESYRKAVQLSPSDYRAWYGLGQTYELLNMNLHALYYYKQATQLRPYDALMWCALGSTFTQLQRPSDAIRAYERALQQNESENFATQKLATLYRNNNQTEDAAQCYMRHLELRYSASHSNVASGMGDVGSVDSLEKLLQGISVESTEAEAIIYLATYYRDNHDFESAASFCSRLLDYPGPEREQAKAMLRELRSRKAKGAAATTTRAGIHTRSKGPVTDGSAMGFFP